MSLCTLLSRLFIGDRISSDVPAARYSLEKQRCKLSSTVQ